MPGQPGAQAGGFPGRGRVELGLLEPAANHESIHLVRRRLPFEDFPNVAQEEAAPIRPASVNVREAVLLRQSPARKQPAALLRDIGVGGQRRHGSADVAGRLRLDEVRILLDGIPPVRLGDAEVVEYPARNAETPASPPQMSLTSTSSRPSSVRTRSNSRSTSDSSVWSVRTAMPRPPGREAAGPTWFTAAIQRIADGSNEAASAARVDPAQTSKAHEIRVGRMEHIASLHRERRQVGICGQVAGRADFLQIGSQPAEVPARRLRNVHVRSRNQLSMRSSASATGSGRRSTRGWVVIRTNPSITIQRGRHPRFPRDTDPTTLWPARAHRSRCCARARAG